MLVEGTQVGSTAHELANLLAHTQSLFLTHAQPHTHANAHIYIHTHTHTYKNIHIHTYTYTYAYTYKHTHTETHKHTHIYTLIHMSHIIVSSHGMGMLHHTFRICELVMSHTLESCHTQMSHVTHN